jgi:hypothetical protein
MSGVSPAGLAENGTRTGKDSFDPAFRRGDFCLFMRLVITNLPSCLPSLAAGLVPSGQHYYEGSESSAERLGGLHAAEASLLISIELLNIPSLTTLLPFRSPRFNTLRFRHRASRLLIPAVAFPPPGVGPHRGFLEVRGSPDTRRLPDRLGQIEFAFATDCSFDSSYSPPFLLKTQLLSTTGR